MADLSVLHVLDHSLPLHSGYVFRTQSILAEQRARGWQTFHLTGPKQGACTCDEEEIEGWRYLRSAAPVGLLGRLPILSHLTVIRAIEQRLDAAVRTLCPDILHAHSPALNGIAALRVARRHGLPLVYEVRAFWEDAAVDHGTSREGGPRYRLTRALETHVLRHAQAVTTICEGLRADMSARGIPDDRLSVIPNAVDVGALRAAPLHAAQLRARLGWQDACVLAFIGSFYAYEGLDLLLDAFARLRGHNARLRLLLAGGGPQEAALRAQAERLALGDAVHFSGRVPHAEVSAWYGVADVCVYPRKPMRLTELVTPLKPLEAMALERPVIASDVGGHRELIADGVTGLLTVAGDAQALARTISQLIAAPEQAARLVRAGHEFVMRERNWRVCVARYAPIYARLTGIAA
jgi:PEP-CTERM/exosortase A-associated glycosyltransferase